VNIPPEVQEVLQRLLLDLNITPVPPSEDPGEPISVLLPLPKPDANPDSLKEQPGVVEWKPPHIDWDPWTFRSAFQEGGRYSQLEPVSVSV